MLEAPTQSLEAKKTKLKKGEFDSQFRFRESREDSLVKCASCIHASGNVEGLWRTTSYCTNPLKSRKTKIIQKDWGSDSNGAQTMVCDAYQSKPLPPDVPAPNLNEVEGFVLGTQFADCLHVDPKCPYVIEEARLQASGERTKKYNRVGELRLVDTSEIVPGEVRRDLCDMPCCESRLQFQIWDPNGYRNRVGIHPNANDRPTRFIRNAITRHGKNSNMTYEEAEEFFDLTKVIAAAEEKERYSIHDKIVAVSDYMHKHTNRLGSKPLSEAVNPVWLDCSFKVLALPNWIKNMMQWVKQDSSNTSADIWMYDSRLFDINAGLSGPLSQLEKIPEGIIPCVDSKGVLKKIERAPEYARLGEGINLYGILKPVENQAWAERGLTHFLEIRHVHYTAHEHWWGESGIGFSEVASFHEQ